MATSLIFDTPKRVHELSDALPQADERAEVVEIAVGLKTVGMSLAHVTLGPGNAHVGLTADDTHDRAAKLTDPGPFVWKAHVIDDDALALVHELGHLPGPGVDPE